jgi:hypothetical protein
MRRKKHTSGEIVRQLWDSEHYRGAKDDLL